MAVSSKLSPSPLINRMLMDTSHHRLRYTDKCQKHGETKSPTNARGFELVKPVCLRCLEDLRDFPETRATMLKVKPSLHLLDYFDETAEAGALRKAEDKKKSAELLAGAISPDRLHLEENPRNASVAHTGGMRFVRKNGDEVRFDTVLTCDSELFPLEYEFFVRPMDNLTAMRAWQEATAKAVAESSLPPKSPHLLPTYFWLQEVHHLNDSLIERQAIQSQDWESLVCFLADYQDGLTRLTNLERSVAQKFGEGYDEEDTARRLGMQVWFVREHLKSANRSLRLSMRLFTKPLKASTLAA